MIKPNNVIWAGASHPGKQRKNNEDAFSIVEELSAAIVADGMGGLAYGERASKLVTTSVITAVSAQQSIADGILDAHRQILSESNNAPNERMGSTALGIIANGREATISWVGDSRAYLWRRGNLQQLTKDHSYVSQLIDVGAIRPEDAEDHPHRHILTRAVGVTDMPELEVDVTTVTLRAGDRVLLCTDGLYGYLGEKNIQFHLSRISNVHALVQSLILATLSQSEAGDNITAVCAGVSG